MINKITNKNKINEYCLLKEIANFHDSELIKISDLNNHSIYIPKISIIKIAKDILQGGKQWTQT